MSDGLRLHDAQGRRKYLTEAERKAFLAAAGKAPRPVRTLCFVLAYTGCRITEALELTASRIDIEAGQIIFESLKKRRRGLYRAVPVPEAVIEALDLVHGLREAQKGRDGGRGVRLWEFSRTSAWRYVAAVLEEAGVRGPQASPKGLRHGFGVQAVSSGVPLNMVQKWLGHAQLTTTAIYADAVGAEEQSIMSRMWAS